MQQYRPQRQRRNKFNWTSALQNALSTGATTFAATGNPYLTAGGTLLGGYLGGKSGPNQPAFDAAPFNQAFNRYQRMVNQSARQNANYVGQQSSQRMARQGLYGSPLGQSIIQNNQNFAIGQAQEQMNAARFQHEFNLANMQFQANQRYDQEMADQYERLIGTVGLALPLINRQLNKPSPEQVQQQMLDSRFDRLAQTPTGFRPAAPPTPVTNVQADPAITGAWNWQQQLRREPGAGQQGGDWRQPQGGQTTPWQFPHPETPTPQQQPQQAVPQQPLSETPPPAPYKTWTEWRLAQPNPPPLRMTAPGVASPLDQIAPVQPVQPPTPAPVNQGNAVRLDPIIVEDERETPEQPPGTPQQPITSTIQPDGTVRVPQIQVPSPLDRSQAPLLRVPQTPAEVATDVILGPEMLAEITEMFPGIFDYEAPTNETPLTFDEVLAQGGIEPTLQVPEQLQPQPEVVQPTMPQPETREPLYRAPRPPDKPPQWRSGLAQPESSGATLPAPQRPVLPQPRTGYTDINPNYPQPVPGEPVVPAPGVTPGRVQMPPIVVEGERDEPNTAQEDIERIMASGEPLPGETTTDFILRKAMEYGMDIDDILRELQTRGAQPPRPQAGLDLIIEPPQPQQIPENRREISSGAPPPEQTQAPFMQGQQPQRTQTPQPQGRQTINPPEGYMSIGTSIGNPERNYENRKALEDANARFNQTPQPNFDGSAGTSPSPETRPTAPSPRQQVQSPQVQPGQVQNAPLPNQQQPAQQLPPSGLSAYEVPGAAEAAQRRPQNPLMQGLPDWFQHVYTDESGYAPARKLKDGTTTNETYNGIEQPTYDEWKRRSDWAKENGAPATVKELETRPDVVNQFYKDYMQGAGIPTELQGNPALEYMYYDIAVNFGPGGKGTAGAKGIYREALGLLRREFEAVRPDIAREQREQGGFYYPDGQVWDQSKGISGPVTFEQWLTPGRLLITLHHVRVERALQSKPEYQKGLLNRATKSLSRSMQMMNQQEGVTF